MKILIINNVGSQGIVLAEKFKYDEVDIYAFKNEVFDTTTTKNYHYLSYWNIFKLLTTKMYKYDIIIFISPIGRLWKAVDLLIDKDIPIIPYFQGSDCRNIDTTKISDKYEVCFYSTPDLKQHLTKFKDHLYIPCEIIPKHKGDNLIFSRNDTFKKTHKYFKLAIRNPEQTFDFIDWFNAPVYKAVFISFMPKNCKLIPKIPPNLVPQVLKGYNKVYGQQSGFKGISEKEIEVYTK